MSKAELVSASVTTGWADWIHGELWVLPNGLLRRRLGLLATVRHMNRRTVSPKNPTVKDLSDDQISVLSKEHERNVFVPRERIRYASIHIGAATSRLRLALEDGTSVKLLWLKQDHAETVLGRVLKEWLGSEHVELD